MKAPSEHDLHAFTDGRLDPERRRAIEAWLAEHPERAAEIGDWQRDAQQLRAATGGWLGENPSLDPARLRARRRARRQMRVVLAAALLACTAAGGAGGWWMRGRGEVAGDEPMADALQAHRMFAVAAELRADVTPSDAADIQDWIDHHLAAAPRLPDLAALGFQPIGGRLLAAADGAAAIVLYRDGHGGAISVYLRPTSRRGPPRRGERSDGSLVARYVSTAGYDVALVSRAGRDAAIARRALAGP